MTTLRTRLLFGPIAGVFLAIAIFGLALMVPGYDQIRQTVSDIGEVGSPAQTPFTVMLLCVAAAILVFASALRDLLKEARRPTAAAYVTGCAAISIAGVGIFSYPHPLHNVIGPTELIGYQAPLVLALTWRSNPRMKGIGTFSWVMAVLVWCAIAANIVTFNRHGALWTAIRPYYGLDQRVLFATWFVWCAGIGIIARSYRPQIAAGASVSSTRA